MPTLFLSYRRADAKADARHLRDGLRRLLPQFRIVRDVDDIPPGEPLEPFIRQAIAACDAVLLLISPGWAGSGADGRRRIDDEQDWVRLELRAALQLHKRVIPVLLYGTPMPRAEELPADLQALARINGIPLQDRSWDQDVQELSRWLRRLVRDHPVHRPAAADAAAVDEPASGSATQRRRGPASRSGPVRWALGLLWALLWACGAAALAYALLLLVNLFDEAPLPPLALPPAATEPAAADDGVRLLRALRELGGRELPLLAGCWRQEEWACPGPDDAQALAAWRAHPALQQAWRALHTAQGFGFPPPPVRGRSDPYDDGEVAAYVRAASLALAEIALGLQQGRRDAAWAALSAELQLRRRIAAAGRDLVMRMVALRSLQAALRLADRALGEAAPTPAQARALAAALAPLGAAERDLSQAMAHELRVFSADVHAAHDAMRRLDTRFSQDVRAFYASLGMAEQAPALLPFETAALNLLAAPMFKRQATLNQLQTLFEQDMARLALPPPVYLDPATSLAYVKRRAPLIASRVGFAALYNPAGKHLLKALERESDSAHARAAAPIAEVYYFELHDTDALLRLVALKLQLRSAGARRADLPALLQKDPRLFDPYTGQPMAWDAEQGEIRASARSRRIGLPAAVRVGDFLR